MSTDNNEPVLSNEEYVDAGGFACPGCEDTRFIKYSVESYLVARLKCTECKATWTDEYTLARYSNFTRDPSAYEPAPPRPVMVYDPLADISRANYNEPGLHTR